MAEGKVEIEVVAKDDGLEKSLDGVKGKAEKSLGGVGKKLGIATKGVVALTTAALGAGAAIAKIGTDFETAFAQVQTIMDPTQKSMEDMKDEILALSEATGVSAAELSGSVYNAISATGDTAGAVSLVESATKLAAAGFSDTESSLSVITTAMNAYGLSAEEAMKISDSLIQTQNLGVTTVAELSASMGKAIASASAYGIDLANVEAAYVAMTKSGISTAESTTYMSSMFKELGSSSSAVSKALQKETGKTFDQLMADGVSLGEVLQTLYKAAGEDSTALMNMWGSAEAGKAANAIISQGTETFTENVGKMRESAGLTETAYETMAGTVAHQTEMLANSVKNLGIGVYEAMQGEIGDLLEEANGWMSELTTGFANGGIDGLSDAAAAVAPKLIKTLTDVFGKALKGVSAILPKLTKNLVGILPDLITGAGDMAANLAEGLAGALATAVEQVIGNLPQIFASLVPAMGKVLFSLLSGSVDLINAFNKGLDQAFHQGQTKLMSGDWVDDDMLKTMNITLDVNYNEEGTPAEDVVERINTIRTILVNGLGGIKGVNAEEIAAKIISGDVSAAIEAALIKGGVSPKKAQKVADSIASANDVIATAVGELGLDESQKATLSSLIASNPTKEQVESYLVSCGVNKTTAAKAAGTITSASGTIQGAVKGLPKGIRASIAGINFVGDKAALIAALTYLGLKPEDIETVTSSYSKTTSTLTAGIEAMFDEITNTLTDGKADTPEQMSGLENSVREWGKAARQKINEWFIDAMTELDNSGLTGEGYENKKAELEGIRDDLLTQVGALETGTADLVLGAANKTGSELEGYISQINDMEGRIKTLSGEIDGLATKVNKASVNAYKLISGGYTNSEETMSIAISGVVSQFKLDQASLIEAKNAEIEKVLNDDTLTDDKKKIKIDGIEAQFKIDTEKSETAVKNQMSSLLLGLAQYSGIASEEINAALNNLDIADAISGILNAGTLDVSKMSDELKAQLAEVFNISPEDLNTQTLINALEKISPEFKGAFQNVVDANGKIWDVDSFNISLQEMFRTLTTSGTKAFSELETGPVGEAIRGWIQAGVFEGIDGLELDGTEADFAKVIAFLSGNMQEVMNSKPATFEQKGEVNYELEEGETTEPEGSGEPEELPPKEAKQTVTTTTDTHYEEGETTGEAPPEDGETKETNTSQTVNNQVTTKSEVTNPEEASETVESQTEAAAASAPPTVVNAETVVALNVTAQVQGTDFNLAGAEAAGAFATGISSGSGAAVAAASGLARSALGGLKGVSAESLGMDFSAGYARGISSGSNAAVNAAVRLAADAIRAVKSTQNSNSPAKATQELGQYFGQGYELGIRESMRDAVETTKALTGEILGASVVGSNGLGVLKIEAGSDPLKVENNTPASPVVLDGHVIGEVQAGINSGEIAMYNRKYKRGVGG